jgi:hypothetical protein
MNKYFTWYCIFLVSFLAYANYQGYVLSNIFGNQSHASQSANHYHK